MAGSPLTAAENAFLAQLRGRYPDKLSRLRGGFYDIKDKDGHVIPFTMNADQEAFILERHGLDVVLKARQRGFTTVIQLDMLDDCLFIPNLSAGIIAHNKIDAQAFFRDKIKFAYDNLPAPFRKLVQAETDSADSLSFSNGSLIRVGTSLRSGTLQRLHVSEYGKLCAKFPQRATEVKSGAFNTVTVGQVITVESTAEGRAGDFYNMTQRAQRLALQGAELTPLDFKFHFSPWWTDPSYSLAADVPITPEMREYFDSIDPHVVARLGRPLSREQRAWYVKKAEQQGETMKREFPSTPEEAFEAAIEGAYFATQMARVRKDKRICRIPVLDVPVDVFWDLGVGDAMALSFRQQVGPEERWIDYFEASGEGFAFFARKLAELANERGYIYRHHYFPHDGAHRRLGVEAKSPKESAETVGIKPVTIVPRIRAESDGIEASRQYLAKCWFDEERCARLIQCLDSYRKAWDDTGKVWKDSAVHDEYSHGYKSFETAAVAKPAAGAASDWDKPIGSSYTGAARA